MQLNTLWLLSLLMGAGLAGAALADRIPSQDLVSVCAPTTTPDRRGQSTPKPTPSPSSGEPTPGTGQGRTSRT